MDFDISIYELIIGNGDLTLENKMKIKLLYVIVFSYN